MSELRTVGVSEEIQHLLKKRGKGFDIGMFLVRDLLAYLPNCAESSAAFAP